MLPALAVIAGVVIVSALASLGYGPVLFRFIRLIPGSDLTCHVVLMALLAFVVCRWLAPRAGFPRTLAWLWIVVALEEASQALIPARSFSAADLLASSVGVAAGGLVAAWGLRAALRVPADTVP